MSEVLLDRLDGVRRRLRRVHLLAGLSRTLLVLIAALAVFFLLDWLVLTRSVESGAVDLTVRAVLVLGVLGVVGTVFSRTVVAELRTERDDDEIAMRVERSHPKLRGRLISTVQLCREEDVGSLVSQEMIDALTEETVSFSEALDFGAIINRRNLKRVGLAALVVALMCGGLGWWRKDYALALLGRLTMRSSDYPTSARIISVTPGHTVGRGDDVTIEVVADSSREVPDTATAALRTADGHAIDLTLSKQPIGKDGQAHFIGTLTKVVDDFSYRPLVLDARWPNWEKVAVLQRPALKSLKLMLHYPAYLKQADEVSAIGDLRAPVGTVVEIQAQLTKPVIKAQYGQRLFTHTVDGKPTETATTTAMKLEGGGTTASAKITVSENGTWTIDLKDADGFDNVDPISFGIDAVPDRPPTVGIKTPAQDKELGKNARWPITFIAHDDHAVAKAKLKWIIVTLDADNADSDAQAKVEAAAEANAKSMSIDIGPAAAQISAKVVFDVSTSGATEGQRITYWIEVLDNHAPDANVGTSARYNFTVLDAKSLAEKLERDRAAAIKQVDELRKRERDSQMGTDSALKALP